MSRSGYCYDCDTSDWAYIMYRGAVASAMNGRRGQAFLKEMLAAMDAMPEKRLISEELEIADVGENGTIVTVEACAIGTVGLARNLDMSNIDPENYSKIADTFGIAESMAREIMSENDEGGGYWLKETPEQRFARMRRWIENQIRKDNESHIGIVHSGR